MKITNITLLILIVLGILVDILIASVMGFSQDFRKEVCKEIDPDEIICSQSRSILFSDVVFLIMGVLLLILLIKSY